VPEGKKKIKASSTNWIVTSRLPLFLSVMCQGYRRVKARPACLAGLKQSAPAEAGAL
jgi:hypothetical protein